jgi:ABC-type branched-subunit amino acid transport system substrate-binding protein
MAAMAWEYGSPLEKLPQGKAFAEKFQKHFGVAILSYAPFGYDAAWAAINAMQKAKKQFRRSEGISSGAEGYFVPGHYGHDRLRQ